MRLISVSVFCRTERVSVPSFYQGRKRLAGSSAGESDAAGTFVPVQLVTNTGIVDLYRAIRVERDSELAIDALSKVPKSSQATINKKTPAVVRHLMVLEKIESSVVDMHRDQFARMRLRK